MPYTAKQNRLFRAAAYDPKISKSSGISRVDAQRMAGEGVKKAKGGVLKQGVGLKDTSHGSLDLPVTMGRAMKRPKRKFQTGGEIDSRKERERAAEMRREADKRKVPLTVGEQEALDNARDEKRRKLEDVAPTTRTTMGEKFATGGNVKTKKFSSQGEVRKSDRYSLAEMPEKEAKRVSASEKRRAETWEGDAQQDYMKTRDARESGIDAYIEGNPKATMREFRKDKTMRYLEDNAQRAEDNMLTVHGENWRVQKGGGKYQYAKGGNVPKRSSAKRRGGIPADVRRAMLLARMQQAAPPAPGIAGLPAGGPVGPVGPPMGAPPMGAPPMGMKHGGKVRGYAKGGDYKHGGDVKKEKWIPPWLAKGKKKFAEGGSVKKQKFFNGGMPLGMGMRGPGGMVPPGMGMRGGRPGMGVRGGWPGMGMRGGPGMGMRGGMVPPGVGMPGGMVPPGVGMPGGMAPPGVGGPPMAPLGVGVDGPPMGAPMGMKKGGDVKKDKWTPPWLKDKKKFAAGGSAGGGRGDGIAQRGRTKGRMC